ncbi:MAG: hypothetical protein HQL76_14090 [Magnetococcales bacterium]|nr:hypothetical protein [Magnetococcales bacterium]
MIKIEIVGPNGENLLRGPWSQRVKRLGLPVAGLLGGMVLSFYLASSLVRSGSEVSVAGAEKEAVLAGVDDTLPVVRDIPEMEGTTGGESMVGAGAYTSGGEPRNRNVAVISGGSSRDSGKGGVSLKGQDHAKRNNVVAGLALNSDPLLEERIQAARAWLAANPGEGGFSIQLMSVLRSNLGGLSGYLSRANLGVSEDQLLAFPVGQDRILLYHGRYASHEEAVRALAMLPAAIRNSGPYVLSGKSIQGKLARLSKDASKPIGLVAALKP